MIFSKYLTLHIYETICSPFLYKWILSSPATNHYTGEAKMQDKSRMLRTTTTLLSPSGQNAVDTYTQIAESRVYFSTAAVMC